jgi:predicted ATPase
MLTALYQPRFPSPLAIEEPEEAIYPDALAVCGDLFQNAIYSHQVFVTTHSLDLITYLPANTLVVVTKEDGCSKVGPISKKQVKAITDNIFEPDDLMPHMEQLRVEPAGH